MVAEEAGWFGWFGGEGHGWWLVVCCGRIEAFVVSAQPVDCGNKTGSGCEPNRKRVEAERYLTFCNLKTQFLSLVVI